MPKLKLSITLEESLVGRIDRKRGDVKRSTFIERILEKSLR